MNNDIKLKSSKKNNHLLVSKVMICKRAFCQEKLIVTMTTAVRAIHVTQSKSSMNMLSNSVRSAIKSKMFYYLVAKNLCYFVI